jgi:putative flippase GtrA
VDECKWIAATSQRLIFALSHMEGLYIFGKFFITGGIGFGVDFGISKTLLQVARFPLLVANSIGFLVGEVLKYSINRYWTFHSTDPEIMLQFGKFISISFIGLTMVNAIVYYLVKKKQQPFFRSKVLAMFVFMFWNFTANYFFTFTH